MIVANDVDCQRRWIVRRLSGGVPVRRSVLPLSCCVMDHTIVSTGLTRPTVVSRLLYQYNNIKFVMSVVTTTLKADTY